MSNTRNFTVVNSIALDERIVVQLRSELKELPGIGTRLRAKESSLEWILVTHSLGGVTAEPFSFQCIVTGVDHQKLPRVGEILTAT